MSTSAALRVGVGVLIAVVAGGASMFAQSRFEPSRREKVGAVPGLEIVTIRDTLLNSCYTLFLMEPPVQTPPPTDSASVQDLARERDRRLAALKDEFERAQYPAAPGLPVPNALTYAWEGDKIKSEYERRVRDKEVARLEEQLAQILNAPRLAVAGPAPCGPPLPAPTAPGR